MIAAVSTPVPLPSLNPASLVAGSDLGTQQLNLSTSAKPAIGAAIFPPQDQTLAGATVPPLAAFSASVLTAVLPTNQAPVVSGPFSTTPVTPPGQPQAPGENQFAASYAPQIYAVYLNGLIESAGVAGATLATNLYKTDIANPPILGDPLAPIPTLPPGQPVPFPAGSQILINSLSSLAGSGQILTPTPSGPAQTATASTASPQSSAASHSQSHVAKT